MKTQRIEQLKQELDQINSNTAVIQTKLQAEYNACFNSNRALQKELNNAECASNYQIGEYGEIESWFRTNILEDFLDCMEYFETYLNETSCMRVDWANSCLIYGQGESLVIQYDTRHDNGVWLNQKCIIDESLYTVDGEVDTGKRNELIEAYMEKTGHYPGVFRADSYGNVFHVDTKKKDWHGET